MSSTAPARPAQPPAVTPPPVGRPRGRTAAWLTAAAALVLVLFGGLAVGGSGAAAVPDGLSDAGPLVELGAPVVTLVGRVAAVATLGALLCAAVLLPGHAGVLTPASRRAVRGASAWASVWAAATVLGAVLTVSRLVGRPPTALPASAVRVFLADTGAGQAVLLVLGLTVLVAAAGARRCSGVPGARVLLAGALAALVVPAVLTGHSSAAEDHLFAVTTLAVHVVAASVWVGGLGALLVYGRRDESLPAAVGRFSALALLCVAATGVTGLVAASVVLGGPGAVLAAVGTGYGWLLLGKTLGLVALTALGWQHRRRTVPQLRAGRAGAFRRFAVVELFVMLATVALAVALAASPPPAAAADGPASTVATPTAGAPAAPPADPMAGHDHGPLTVGVLVDDTRFHVAHPVAPGSRVTVFNGSDQEETLTAGDGSFDLTVPAGSLTTFPAPDQPGRYAFTSRHSPAYADVLTVE
ncbi:CopD family protein [Modestobacter sp. VKM Ac-2986]|uniref:copper resistance D family protein n=1 Tax=Modestobacter sp. VKM Ac-2986 TaxID=3004140 RepID=UPI0022AA2D8E|nr:CopD family protein [Modestobacter sp. VKM Ac-2986]MCZ2828960.1 CopD family protein [Modestobacter sp. VKM Ac-2986]